MILFQAAAIVPRQDGLKGWAEEWFQQCSASSCVICVDLFTKASCPGHSLKLYYSDITFWGDSGMDNLALAAG